MYFQPKEILACGAISPAVQRMLKAFVSTNGGTTLEEVDVKEQSPAAAAQVHLASKYLLRSFSVQDRASGRFVCVRGGSLSFLLFSCAECFLRSVHSPLTKTLCTNVLS